MKEGQGDKTLAPEHDRGLAPSSLQRWSPAQDSQHEQSASLQAALTGLTGSKKKRKRREKDMKVGRAILGDILWGSWTEYQDVL